MQALETKSAELRDLHLVLSEATHVNTYKATSRKVIGLPACPRQDERQGESEPVLGQSSPLCTFTQTGRTHRAWFELNPIHCRRLDLYHLLLPDRGHSSRNPPLFYRLASDRRFTLSPTLHSIHLKAQHHRRCTRLYLAAHFTPVYLVDAFANR